MLLLLADGLSSALRGASNWTCRLHVGVGIMCTRSRALGMYRHVHRVGCTSAMQVPLEAVPVSHKNQPRASFPVPACGTAHSAGRFEYCPNQRNPENWKLRHTQLHFCFTRHPPPRSAGSCRNCPCACSRASHIAALARVPVGCRCEMAGQLPGMKAPVCQRGGGGPHNPPLPGPSTSPGGARAGAHAGFPKGPAHSQMPVFLPLVEGHPPSHC